VRVYRPKHHAVFLTHTAPVPLVSGERIRTFHLVRELVRREWRVSLFSLVPGDYPEPDALAPLHDLDVDIELRPFPAGSIPHRARLMRDVITRRPVHRDLFVDAHSVHAFREWVTGREADVLISGLNMLPYVPSDSYSRLVLDSHNAEARRISGMARAGRGLRSWAARLQVAPVSRYEAAAARAARQVIAVSQVEQNYFERIAPGKVTLVPNGVDTTALAPRTSLPASRSFLFLGSMDYSANVDAVSYLVQKVAPRVRSDDVELIVAGSNPRPAVYKAVEQAPSNVRAKVVGFVPDTSPYFESCRAFVVPLRYGGGTRLKILEALARGVPVLSTPVGCEGLDLRDGTEILVREDPFAFAAALDRLLADDELCLQLAEAGRKAVEQRYDWSAIGGAFSETLSHVAR
jgi:glycosyltransferase involved in cell wall biosynthesis